MMPWWVKDDLMRRVAWSWNGCHRKGEVMEVWRREGGCHQKKTGKKKKRIELEKGRPQSRLPRPALLCAALRGTLTSERRLTHQADRDVGLIWLRGNSSKQREGPVEFPTRRLFVFSLFLLFSFPLTLSPPYPPSHNPTMDAQLNQFFAQVDKDQNIYVDRLREVVAIPR